MSKDHLSMWTVYDHPTDYPNCYVAREFRVTDKGPVVTNNIIITPSLEQLRAILFVEMHLTCLTCNEGDDPKIVETWL